MKKHIEYKTKGTCSRMITLDIEDGKITDCSFLGGCAGNTAGISSLVRGMDAAKAAEKLKGIRCGFKPTSCPDQLSKAIEEALASSEE